MTRNRLPENSTGLKRIDPAIDKHNENISFTPDKSEVVA